MFTAPINTLSKADTPFVGGKGAMLGELTTLAASLSVTPKVPDGFVVTTEAFEAWMSTSELKDENITRTLNVVGRDIPQLDQVQSKIYNHLKRVNMPFFDLPTLKQDKLYAVRSSGVDEDGDNSSFAGQHDTFLNVPYNEIEQRIKDVWLSSFSQRALYYRIVKGITDRPIRQAVVVQEMVNKPKWAGTAFSADPRTGRRDHGLIEYIEGLGEDLVSGKKTPTLINFMHDTTYHPSSWLTPCVYPVLATTLELQKILGYPVDIEWAWDTELNLLQARPITTLPNELDAETAAKMNVATSKFGTAKCVGQPLAGGRIRALGFVNRTQALEAVNTGYANGRYIDLSKRILLVPYTTPDDLPIMEKVAGIVVSKGGQTSHAAIVCREMGKPCVRVKALAELKHNPRSFTSRPLLMDGNNGAIFDLPSVYNVDVTDDKDLE